ncbi:MAG: hypothetical protein HY060_18740 [Proteobacteria bacterium]|nr:hypothetical protein [Pseudomonadota bacterium]
MTPDQGARRDRRLVSDYGATAAAYVDAFMQAMRWDGAAQRFVQYGRRP